MDSQNSLRSLDDPSLLHQFNRLVQDDRRNRANMLRHLAEIDRRKLWAKQGHPSMFDWCVVRFNMSESMAGKRIGAARTARRFLVLFDMVARGDLHLSGIDRLKAHLTVLDQAIQRSTRQIEKLVARLAPQPDATSRIRKLPDRAPTGGEAAAAAGAGREQPRGVDAPGASELVPDQAEATLTDPSGHDDAAAPADSAHPPGGRGPAPTVRLHPTGAALTRPASAVAGALQATGHTRPDRSRPAQAAAGSFGASDPRRRSCQDHPAGSCRLARRNRKAKSCIAPATARIQGDFDHPRARQACVSPPRYPRTHPTRGLAAGSGALRLHWRRGAALRGNSLLGVRPHTSLGQRRRA